MRVLNNPRYAGAYFSDGHAGDGGRKEAAPTAQSLSQKTVARADPGSTSWLYRVETYEGNLKRLEENCRVTRSI